MRTNTDVRLHFNLEINLTAAPPFPYYNAFPATKFYLSQDITMVWTSKWKSYRQLSKRKWKKFSRFDETDDWGVK